MAVDTEAIVVHRDARILLIMTEVEAEAEVVVGAAAVVEVGPQVVVVAGAEAPSENEGGAIANVTGEIAVRGGIFHHLSICLRRKLIYSFWMHFRTFCDTANHLSTSL